MNLRNAENYTIGLDLGTGSVGWAVVDEEGKLYHIKGQPTWGARLFASANTAAETRMKRGQRRRYARRRQRLDELQKYFFADMEQVDPDFFVRLRQARLLNEDKDESIREYRWPLFNSKDFTEAEYYSMYPTIYHLRKHLMESDEKADIRLIYLALHHIVKYRGNFLYESEGSSLKAKSANAAAAARKLSLALREYFEDVLEVDENLSPDENGIRVALDGGGVARRARAAALLKAFGVRDSESKARCKLIANACLGYKVEFGNVFAGLEATEGTKVALSDEEAVESFVDDLCPDEARALIEAIQGAYSSYILSGILAGATSLSEAMVRSYERHDHDLALIKGLFRDYLPRKQYLDFFRGARDGKGNYDINELVRSSYTSYVAGEKKANKRGTTHAELIKKIRLLCESCPELTLDARYLEIKDRLEMGEDSDILQKQRTRMNGAIPYQLHLEEMGAIIEKQSSYYPFLAEHRDELEKLVCARIPYYVGPLNGGHDPLLHYSGNPVDPSRKYGWAKRRHGKEHVKAYPWNVDEVIDTDVTAERFIQRMTGTCTYLMGEPVLPRHSLLYEEYCVLNELNGVKWCRRGGTPRRFSPDDKEELFQALFKDRRSANVSYAILKKWLLEERGVVDAEIVGAQGETGLESKLSTYHDFCKILGVRSLEEEAPLTLEELEEIVLWNTVFEDRSILRRKVSEKYGPDGDGRLSADQIKKLVNRRYSGWGRLSKKLLVGIRVPASVPTGFVSIMDVLRQGNPFANRRQVVFMEALSDKDLDFSGAIEKLNRDNLQESGAQLTVDDMSGSPANRRSVNQAMRIVDELVRIAKKPPARICIEVTRDDDWSRKGTRTRRRYDRLKESLEAIKADAKLLKELEERKELLDNDRLALYFEQQGKCMYSGDELDIAQLETYQIDHILPQAYIKDDSFDNRVLVKSKYNQRKGDSLLLDDGIIDARVRWWRAMRNAGLISVKKFERLTCRSLSERQINGFINRQLVETSQIVKFVQLMCRQKYSSTEIVSVRASISHGVRENLGLVKCRELNSYHHAHDAYIACQVAEFVDRCYPQWQDGLSLALIRKHMAALRGGSASSRVPGKSGFIVDSMTQARHVDIATGEVVWDNEERNASIVRCLNYKTCFISRMAEVSTGAFWDETVYSPRDNKKRKGLTTPLKASLSSRNHEGYLEPQTYGGVSKVSQAYWFIFVAKDSKGHHKYFFEGVPIYRANQVGDALQAYADELAAKAKCSNARIPHARGEKVLLGQKFEMDGTPYRLGGKTGNSNEVLLANEMWGTVETTRLVSRLTHGKDEPLTDEDLMKLYDWLTEQAARVSEWLASVLKLEDRRGQFETLAKEDKVRTLTSLLYRLNGKNRDVDMRMLGGAGQAGKLARPIASYLSRIVWIDQSITGIFEKRTTFEDICRGL